MVGTIGLDAYSTACTHSGQLHCMVFGIQGLPPIHQAAILRINGKGVEQFGTYDAAIYLHNIDSICTLNLEWL